MYECIGILLDAESHRAAEVDVRKVRRPDATQPVVLDSRAVALEPLDHVMLPACVPGQSKYVNNIVEQDHRAIKRNVRPMMGFKAFRCARINLAGIETMHMIKKGQLQRPKDKALSAASQFYSLAF